MFQDSLWWFGIKITKNLIEEKKSHKYFCHAIINFRRQFTENIFVSVANNFLLLLNLMSWMLWTPESHLCLSLTVLAENRNIVQHQINLLEILADKVFPAAVWFAARYLQSADGRYKLVDSSGGLVFSLSQDMTEPLNMVLNDDLWGCSAGQSVL